MKECIWFASPKYIDIVSHNLHTKTMTLLWQGNRGKSVDYASRGQRLRVADEGRRGLSHPCRKGKHSLIGNQKRGRDPLFWSEGERKKLYEFQLSKAQKVCIDTFYEVSK